MAVSPPGDIVLDVLRAADPARVSEARAKLAAAAPSETARSSAEEAFDAAYALSARERFAPENAEDIAATEAARKFEAMVLSNFVQSMLPAEAEEMFGKGMAGTIWKSMMAEQLANTLAEGGGIGIAKAVMADDALTPEDANRAPDLGGARMTNLILDEIERNTLAGWGEADDAEDLSLFGSRA